MKILITGGAGFIGSTLADKLLRRGDEVVVIDNFNDYYNPARKRANAAPLLQQRNFRLVEGDIRDTALLDQVIGSERPDTIAHIAAMASVRYSITHAPLYIDVNIVGTTNLLEAAVKHKVQNFVFASTSSVYGQTTKIPFVETDPTDRPLAPYPATKKTGEVLGHAYHNMHGLNFTALRFFNVYGPKGRPDMMPYIVTDCLAHDREFTLFDNGQMHRDWTFIEDIVSGVTSAVDHPFPYEIFNLGRGEPVLMADFINILEELLGKTARIRHEKAPASEPKITFANVDKARRLLNYAPKTSIVDGLTRFWEWYQQELLNK